MTGVTGMTGMTGIASQNYPDDEVEGIVPFPEQKIQGYFKEFQGHISHFSRILIRD